MKTKSYKPFSLLMLAIVLMMAIAQLAFASNVGYRNTQVQASPSGPTDPAEFEAFLDAYLAEQMETHHIPGVVFTMVKDGEVFFLKAYGYADLEDQTPMDTAATILTTASLEKLFT